jgi:hypothetical protein
MQSFPYSSNPISYAQTPEIWSDNVVYTYLAGETQSYSNSPINGVVSLETPTSFSTIPSNLASEAHSDLLDIDLAAILNPISEYNVPESHPNTPFFPWDERQTHFVSTNAVVPTAVIPSGFQTIGLQPTLPQEPVLNETSGDDGSLLWQPKTFRCGGNCGNVFW